MAVVAGSQALLHVALPATVELTGAGPNSKFDQFGVALNAGVLCLAAGAFLGATRRRAARRGDARPQRGTVTSPVRLLVSPLAVPLDASPAADGGGGGDRGGGGDKARQRQRHAAAYGSINSNDV